MAEIPGNSEMIITILSDGTIKTETGDMSGPTHKAADDFLKMVARLAGGEVTERKAERGRPHHHTHSHGHTHHKH